MGMALDRTRRDIVGLALTAGYIVGLQVGKVPPALPVLQEELAMARVSAGLVASSFYGRPLPAPRRRRRRWPASPRS